MVIQEKRSQTACNSGEKTVITSNVEAPQTRGDPMDVAIKRDCSGERTDSKSINLRDRSCKLSKPRTISPTQRFTAKSNITTRRTSVNTLPTQQCHSITKENPVPSLPKMKVTEIAGDPL